MITWTAILSLGKRLVANKWFWIGILIASIMLLGWKLKKLSDENKRLSRNNEVLVKDFNKEKTKSGELRVTVGELTDIIAQDSTLIAHLYDSLRLKERQIESLVQLEQATEVDTVIKWKDKIITVTDSSGSNLDTVRCLDYSDEWIKIEGCELPDLSGVDINIEVKDEISIVAYKYKDVKWFLPRLWKPWKYTTAVENSNPYNTITIKKNIKVIKR